MLTSRGYPKHSEDLYQHIIYSVNTVRQLIRDSIESHSDFNEIKNSSFEDFIFWDLVRLPGTCQWAWYLEIFVRLDIFKTHWFQCHHCIVVWTLPPQPKRNFCNRRVVKTRFWSDQWAAAPLQLVANQWVSWKGRFHSNQFITTFTLPAIMECRLCLSALPSSSIVCIYTVH